MKKIVKNPKPRRTLHLDARVSQEEFDTIKNKAKECGLTLAITFEDALWIIVLSDILRTRR